MLLLLLLDERLGLMLLLLRLLLDERLGLMLLLLRLLSLLRPPPRVLPPPEDFLLERVEVLGRTEPLPLLERVLGRTVLLLEGVDGFERVLGRTVLLGFGRVGVPDCIVLLSFGRVDVLGRVLGCIVLLLLFERVDEFELLFPLNVLLGLALVLRVEVERSATPG
jgi:hypothetical protein